MERCNQVFPCLVSEDFRFLVDRHTSKKKEWFAIDRDRQTDALPENPVYILLASLSSDLLKTTNNVVKIVIVFSE